ncbi:hypothetical protein H9P43_005723 [Blastocladiella emersonii ATCC 22665]|nr:hypothetical protein H9P43_005723 [Blastocladiella emersonii ATCC 22665]
MHRHRRTRSESALVDHLYSHAPTATGPRVAFHTPTGSTVLLWKPERNLDARGKLKSALRSPPDAAAVGGAGKDEGSFGYINAINDFKRQNERLAAEKAELARQIESLKLQLTVVREEKAEIQKEVQRQATHVANILSPDRDKLPSIDQERQTEMLFMMQREINGNLALKDQIAACQQRIQILETYAKEQTISLKERDNIIQHQQYLYDQAKEEIVAHKEQIRTLEFQLDQVRVHNVKMEKQVKVALAKEEEWREEVTRLQGSEGQAKNENTQLREKLAEMIKVTEEIHANFEELKRNMDSKKEQFAQLSQEIEEARNLYAVLMSQKKQLQSELGVMVRQRNEAIEKNRNLESTLLKKEREINELLDKVNETVKDYENKLEKKEEQMWAMTEKLNEEASQTKLQMSNIEREKMLEMERKLEAQARAFSEETESLQIALKNAEGKLASINRNISDLQSRQYEPRMERLRAIERDLKSRMEEYMLAEESLETALICSKCLQFFRQPQSLVPCGHTFCRECIAQIRAENYDRVVCPECTPPIPDVAHVFRNEGLESLTERFMRRKSLVISMMSWIKVLRVFGPEDGEKRQR